MTDEQAVPATPSASPGVPRRAMSFGGQALGLVGTIVTLLLIVVVIAGRGWATGQVTSVAATIDDGLAQGAPLLERAGDRVSEVRARVSAVGEVATIVATSAQPAPELTAAIRERINAVTEPYLALRERYGEARARAVSAIDRLALVDRLVPGFSVPEGPAAALAALDEKVAALDAIVARIITVSATSAAERIAAEADRLLAALDAVLDRLDTAQVRLQEARASVASTADTVNLVITIVALVVLLLLLYIAVLHVVLFRSARGMRAARPAP